MKNIIAADALRVVSYIPVDSCGGVVNIAFYYKDLSTGRVNLDWVLNCISPTPPPQRWYT